MVLLVVSNPDTAAIPSKGRMRLDPRALRQATVDRGQVHIVVLGDFLGGPANRVRHLVQANGLDDRMPVHGGLVGGGMLGSVAGGFGVRVADARGSEVHFDPFARVYCPPCLLNPWI